MIYCEEWLEWSFENIVALPLKLTGDSRFRLVRVLGLLGMVPWYPVAGAGLLFVCAPLLIGCIFEGAWKNEL